MILNPPSRPVSVGLGFSALSALSCGQSGSDLGPSRTSSFPPDSHPYRAGLIAPHLVEQRVLQLRRVLVVAHTIAEEDVECGVTSGTQAA